MTHPPITVIAYGSLMSGLGLSGLGHLPVLHAAPVRFRNARRGFGKLSQYGDRYAMVLEPVQRQEPIVADGADSQGDGLDALALTVSLNDCARVAVREGYRAAAVFALAERAATAGATLPEYLWQTLSAAGGDLARYRAALFDAIDYTSPHYIPHPIAMPGGPAALTFLPPGEEGSGHDAVVPIRVRTGMTRVLSLAEAWRLKPNNSQLDYFAMCLLVELHGLSLAEVLDGIEEDTELVAALHERLARDISAERPRFRAVLGLAEDAYVAQFQRGPNRVRFVGV